MPTFLTIQDVMDILKVSDKTVRRLIYGGDIDAIRVGKSLRINSESVQTYVQRASVKKWRCK